MNKSANSSVTPRDARNSKRYVGLQFLWAVVFVGCTGLLGGEYIESVPLRWLIAFVPSLFAAIAARAYWQYLQGMDELLRAIELKALAMSITAGAVVWPAVMLVQIGVPLEFHLPVTLILMTGFYVYGVAKGRLDTL